MFRNTSLQFLLLLHYVIKMSLVCVVTILESNKALEYILYGEYSTVEGVYRHSAAPRTEQPSRLCGIRNIERPVSTYCLNNHLM